MRDPELVRGLQERAARALPAHRVEDRHGWWLRHAPGCAWWVGTVLPHGAAGPRELPHRVTEAERFYADYGAVARFQITPGVCPDRLDPLLAERDYRLESPMSLQVAPTPPVAERVPAGGPRVTVDDHPAPAWLDALAAVHRHGDDSGAERDLLDRVDLPSAYARAIVEDEVVAVGRAVADTGWAGLFGMATLPRARGKGAARTVLAALAGWAATHRAHHLYLQVERGNLAALRLYARAGFAEACGYHYRAAAGPRA